MQGQVYHESAPVHYDPADGSWDGQLPAVDLISQLPPPAPWPHSSPICDSAVSRYTALTGPAMKPLTRLVLRTIGDFVDPAEGTCNPSMSTIADWAGCSKGSVSNAVKELRLLGLIEVESLPTATGRGVEYRYSFVHGVTTTWTPKPRENLEGKSLDLHRLEELARAKAVLAAHGIDMDTGEMSDLSVQHVNERKREDNSVQNSDVESIPLSSDYGHEYSLDQPPLDFNEEYVRWAISQLPEWLGAWTHGLAAAVKTYRAHQWSMFLGDLAKHRDGGGNKQKVGKGQMWCKGCKQVRGTVESYNGYCGQCKHFRSYKEALAQSD